MIIKSKEAQRVGTAGSAEKRPLGLRRKKERATLATMFLLYRQQHPDAADLELDALLLYAENRLARCYFQEQKPACQKCPVHCYQPQKRQQIKQVMRWAGPRMFWRHPLVALAHLLATLRPVPPYPRRK